jgi:hypothetical protein
MAGNMWWSKVTHPMVARQQTAAKKKGLGSKAFPYGPSFSNEAPLPNSAVSYEFINALLH